MSFPTHTDRFRVKDGAFDGTRFDDNEGQIGKLERPPVEYPGRMESLGFNPKTTGILWYEDKQAWNYIRPSEVEPVPPKDNTDS